MKLLLPLVSLFMLTAAGVGAVPVEPNIKINCEIQHLKALKMLNESYPSYPGASTDDCTDIIEEETQKTFRSVIDMFQMENSRERENCIVSNLKASKWPETNFLVDVYIRSTMLPEYEKDTKAYEIPPINTDFTMKMIGPCVYSEIFSELFDKLMSTAANDVNSDPFQKYCERKYVVDNHLIDSSYNVILNPENLDASAAKCDGFLEQVKKGIDMSIVEKLSREFFLGGSRTCARKKFKELGFTDKLMAVIVLGETRLTEQQRQTEKKKFTEMSTNTVDEVDKCKA